MCKMYWPALACALAMAACAAEKEPTTVAAGEKVTADDVVEIDDLTTNDSDEAGAAKAGDPAVWLDVGRKISANAHANVKAILQHVKDVAAGEPTRTGSTKDGKFQYGVWEKTNAAGVTGKLLVVRIADKKLRYTLFAKSSTAKDYKIILTGVFVKFGKKAGGGRFHLSLKNASDVVPALGFETGSIHFWFANKNAAKAKARRILYVNVKKTGDVIANNAGFDYVHKIGVGGRFRGIAVGPDVLKDRDGVESLAFRMFWGKGKGGRLDGVIAGLTPPPPKKLIEVHECWNAEGLRDAYDDDDLASKETKDGAKIDKCGDFAKEVIEKAKAEGGKGGDIDAEVDAELKDAGALDIDEGAADASDTDA
jgi:hypothetical protein